MIADLIDKHGNERNKNGEVPEKAERSESQRLKAQSESLSNCHLLRDSLLQALKSSDEAVRVSRLPKPGSPIRASALGKQCQRMWTILSQSGRERIQERLTSESRWTLAKGEGHHVMMQGECLRSLGPVFQGWWRCRSCGIAHVGQSDGDIDESDLLPEFYGRAPMIHKSDLPRTPYIPYGWIPCPRVCGECGADHDGFISSTAKPLFEYMEITVGMDGVTSGHVDGVLNWNEWDGFEDVSGVELLELKTISGRGFNYVNPELMNGPRDDHLLQTTVYRYLTGVHRTRIVYMNKQGRMLSDSLAEHSIEGVDKMDEIFDLIRAMQEVGSSESGDLPERLDECRKKSDFRPKYKCLCPAECFQRG